MLRALTRWNCCLAAIAYAYLCQRNVYYDFCKDQLSEQELAAVQAARQPPILALSVMSSLLKRWVKWAMLAGHCPLACRLLAE